MIHEVDHHHVLQFKYQRWANGEVRSDFVMGNAPALAFAARATSSFPGAFPPSRIADMDRLVADRKALWPLREHFISNNFRNGHRMANVDPVGASFIDGSVLNNRPFREASMPFTAAARLPSGRPSACVYRSRSHSNFCYDGQTRPCRASSQRCGAQCRISFPRTQPVTDERELKPVSGVLTSSVSRGQDIHPERPAAQQRFPCGIMRLAKPLDKKNHGRRTQRWREKAQYARCDGARICLRELCLA